jgi:hypothetical protein
MSDSTHPAARSDGAIRILEHTLLDVCARLRVGSSALDARQVVFTQPGQGNRLVRRWTAGLGDWLIRDGSSFCPVVAHADRVTPAVVTKIDPSTPLPA